MGTNQRTRDIGLFRTGINPSRLDDSKPDPEDGNRSSEVLIVREISVPAPFTVGEHDNVAAMVFEHERDDPDYVIYQRLIDGV